MTGLLGRPKQKAGLLGPYAPMGAGTKYGTRPDGTAKGEGFFGLLLRPDGDISTEISASTDALNGAEFPLLVPTLTPEEVNHLLSIPTDDPGFYQKLNPIIITKAEEFAKQRAAQGLPLFARRDESKKP